MLPQDVTLRSASPDVSPKVALDSHDMMSYNYD